jgi:hypothetical protein
MSLKKGLCEINRSCDECSLDIDPKTCSARDKNGYCLSIIFDVPDEQSGCCYED